MSTIIAARFGGQADVQHAANALLAAGFEAGRQCAFYVNPPGMHDLYRYGGDHNASPGAEESGMGSVAGIAVGATIGFAAVPLIGPVGPFLGAYVGSFVGGVTRTKDLEHMPANSHCEHQSGMMLAVALMRPDERAQAIDLLAQMGGFDLEEAQGTIEAGDWVDFDPRDEPHLLRPRF